MVGEYIKIDLKNIMRVKGLDCSGSDYGHVTEFIITFMEPSVAYKMKDFFKIWATRSF